MTQIEKYGYGSFRVGMGAEAIQELLKAIDLEKDSEDLRNQLTGCNRTEACPHHQASGSRRGIPKFRQQTGVDDHDR